MTSDTNVLRERLIGMIESGRFRHQERLPTERRLSEMLGTTRWCLRKALTLLEAEGRLWRHVGRGTFVGARPVAVDENLAMLCRHGSPVELIETRILVEPSLAALAAVRATPARIEEIADIAQKCASARDMASYETWDESFHRAVAMASGNVVLGSIFNGISVLRREIVRGWMRKNELRRQRRQIYAEQHMEVVAAIEQRDPEEARRAMRQHLKALESVYADLQAASVDGEVSVLRPGAGAVDPSPCERPG